MQHRAAPPWLRLVSPVTSVCALGVLGFVYGIALLPAAGIEGEARDLSLFLYGGLLLPPICAAISLFLVGPNFSDPKAGMVETINSWVAAIVVLALAALPVLMFARGLQADVVDEREGNRSRRRRRAGRRACRCDGFAGDGTAT